MIKLQKQRTEQQQLPEFGGRGDGKQGKGVVLKGQQKDPCADGTVLYTDCTGGYVIAITRHRTKYTHKLVQAN